MHAGQEAQITFDALPGRAFSGPIANLNPAADPATRQFGIKVRLNNKDHIVRPGMYAKILIVTRNVNANVVVPKESLATASDGSTTVTVVDQGVAHVRPVKLGAADERGSEVIEGVKNGESVVVLTFNQLKDGQKVKIASDDTAGSTGSKGAKAGNKGGKKPRSQADGEQAKP